MSRFAHKSDPQLPKKKGVGGGVQPIQAMPVFRTFFKGIPYLLRSLRDVQILRIHFGGRRGQTKELQLRGVGLVNYYIVKTM